MPKIGGKRKKSRTHKEIEENDESSTGKQNPRSLINNYQAFIIKRGSIPHSLKEVLSDFREVMYPHTAINLKESGSSKLKDFLSAAGGYGVTHMILFSSTDKGSYIRFCKLPDGPTLTFKILSYSHRKDILNSQKKKKTFSRSLQAPLLILNGFTNIKPKNNDQMRPNENQLSVAYLMLQNMFPPLDLAKMNISQTNKAALFSYDQNNDIVDFRYYGIMKTPVGINKKIKNLLTSKNVPNLHKYSDISQYILNDADAMSEVDVEDTLEDDDIKSNVSKVSSAQGGSSKTSIRLHEIGPRLRLRLIKIQEGFMKGNIAYHKLIQKTKEEIQEQKSKIKEKIKKKEELRKKQQENVNRKMAEALLKKEKKKLKHNGEENEIEEEDKEEEEKKENGRDDNDEEENDNNLEGDGNSNEESVEYDRVSDVQSFDEYMA